MYHQLDESRRRMIDTAIERQFKDTRPPLKDETRNLLRDLLAAPAPREYLELVEAAEILGGGKLFSPLSSPPQILRQRSLPNHVTILDTAYSHSGPRYMNMRFDETASKDPHFDYWKILQAEFRVAIDIGRAVNQGKHFHDAMQEAMSRDIHRAASEEISMRMLSRMPLMTTGLQDQDSPPPSVIGASLAGAGLAMHTLMKKQEKKREEKRLEDGGTPTPGQCPDKL